MLNYIWFGMMAIAVAAGIYNGKIDAVTEAAIDMAKVSVEIAIGLIGIMALWLGTMKIAEASGLIRIIARLLKPITIRLFPDVPADHPAIGSIVLNMSANILGLGNAATPLGLKAMNELQELNPEKDTATNAQIMFLVLNTSGLTLIPGPQTLWSEILYAANEKVHHLSDLLLRRVRIGYRRAPRTNALRASSSRPARSRKRSRRWYSRSPAN